MFWFFLYRVVSFVLFTAGLPLVVAICFFVKKWRIGLDQKLGLIGYTEIKAVRGARFVDLMKELAVTEANKSEFDFSQNLKQQNIWLHAVSFGEVKTIEPLVYELQKRFPEHHICLSVGTQTGFELANKLFCQSAASLNQPTESSLKPVFVFFKPFDTYFAVKNWLDLIKPSMLLIAETELWPELLMQCASRKVPCFLVNARLSEKSAAGYAKSAPLWKCVLQSFKTIFAQSSIEEKLFLSIGAQQSQIQVAGNLKLDCVKIESPEFISNLKRQLLINDNDLVLIAGSTHITEEELNLKAFQRLRKDLPKKNIKLILAPRHPERTEAVCSLVKQFDSSLKLYKKSELDKFSASEEYLDSVWDVLLLDTLGELTKLYSVADFAFIGGTWAKIGGHNPLEAVCYGLPTFVGPQTFKIQALVEQLKQQQILQQFASEEEFYQVLLAEIKMGLSKKTEIQQTLLKSQGVAIRTLNEIKRLL